MKNMQIGTSRSNPELIRPGRVVSSCGKYYLVCFSIDEKHATQHNPSGWYGASYGSSLAVPQISTFCFRIAEPFQIYDDAVLDCIGKSDV